MKLNIVAIFSILILSIFIGACGPAPVANNGSAAVNNAVATKTNTENPVAVTTPTPASTTNDAPTLSPVFKAQCEALLKKDEAALRKVYSADTLKHFADQMKDNKVSSLVKFLEDDVPTGPCSVKNEVITGERAVADLVSSVYPKGFPIVFVKENGEWKLTAQSPTFDAVKPSAPAAPAK